MAAMSMFAVKLCISVSRRTLYAQSFGPYVVCSDTFCFYLQGEGSASMTAVCKLETGLGALQVFYTLDLLLVQIIWRH